MSTNQKFIEVDERWYVAFYDSMYGDYVIEFSKSFESRAAAEQALTDGEVKDTQEEYEYDL